MSDNSTFYAVLSNARAREADEAIAAANDWRQYGEQMARSLIQMNIMRDMLLDELERVSGEWYYDRLNTFEKRVEHYRRLDNQVDEYAKRLGITAYQRQPSRSPEAVAVDRMEKAGLPVTDEQRRIAREAERRMRPKRDSSKIKQAWSWIKLLISLGILGTVALSVSPCVRIVVASSELVILRDRGRKEARGGSIFARAQGSGNAQAFAA